MVRCVAIVIFLIVGALQVNGQCSKDTDCKGDRICVRGECVDQKNIQATPPTTQPTQAASQPATQSAPVATQPESQSTPKSSIPNATGAPDLSKCTYEVGAALGVWFAGTVHSNISGYGEDYDKDASFMMRFYLDGYLMPKFAVGLVMYWEPSITVWGESGHAFEIDGSIRPRFLLSPQVAIKPTLEIGYRNSGRKI